MLTLCLTLRCLNNDTVENERDKMVITPYDTELFMSEYL